jgi:dTDP-4-amino-4,6-dideoxygalactose transaminase
VQRGRLPLPGVPPVKPLLDKPFIVFGKPSIGQAEKDAVRDVLDSGWLSTGSKVKAFEAEFERLHGRRACRRRVVLHGSADHFAARLRRGAGDEVITTPLTFVATVNAILSLGAKPVFVDVRPDGQIDPEKVERVITKRTIAIVPVHYTGAPAPLGRTALHWP